MQKMSLKEMKKWINSLPENMLEDNAILCDEDGKCYSIEECKVDPFERGKQTVKRPILYFTKRLGR